MSEDYVRNQSVVAEVNFFETCYNEEPVGVGSRGMNHYTIYEDASICLHGPSGIGSSPKFLLP